MSEVTGSPFSEEPGRRSELSSDGPHAADADPTAAGSSASAPGAAPSSPGSGPRVSWKGIGWLPVWLVLGGYFVWMCTSMAGEAPNGIGGSSLIALLVAVAAGLIAGGLALTAGRRQGG